MKQSVLLLLALVLCGCCFAADTIIVHRDNRLDVLTAKQAAINKNAGMLTPGGQYKGYRLQIMVTHNRDEANATQAKFQSMFMDEKAYLTFLSPNYKVKVGNFLNREEAQTFKDLLDKAYPGLLTYIMEDVIEYIPRETVPAN